MSAGPKAAGCLITREDFPRLCATGSLYCGQLGVGSSTALLGLCIPYFAEKFSMQLTSFGEIFCFAGVGYFCGILIATKIVESNNKASKTLLALLAITFSGIACAFITILHSYNQLKFLLFLEFVGFGQCDTFSSITISEMWGQRVQPWMQSKSAFYALGGIIPPVLLHKTGFPTVIIITSLFCFSAWLGVSIEHVVEYYQFSISQYSHVYTNVENDDYKDNNQSIQVTKISKESKDISFAGNKIKPENTPILKDSNRSKPFKDYSSTSNNNDSTDSNNGNNNSSSHHTSPISTPDKSGIGSKSGSNDIPTNSTKNSSKYLASRSKSTNELSMDPMDPMSAQASDSGSGSRTTALLHSNSANIDHSNSSNHSPSLFQFTNNDRTRKARELSSIEHILTNFSTRKGNLLCANPSDNIITNILDASAYCNIAQPVSSLGVNSNQHNAITTNSGTSGNSGTPDAKQDPLLNITLSAVSDHISSSSSDMPCINKTLAFATSDIITNIEKVHAYTQLKSSSLSLDASSHDQNNHKNNAHHYSKLGSARRGDHIYMKGKEYYEGDVHSSHDEDILIPSDSSTSVNPYVDDDLPIRLVPLSVRFLLTSMTFCFMGVYCSSNGWFPTYVTIAMSQDIFNLPLNTSVQEEAAVGRLVTSLFYLSMTVGCGLSIPCTVYFSTTTMLRYHLCLVGASLVLLGCAPYNSLTLLYLGAIFLGYGLSSLFPLILTIVNDYGLTL